MKSIFHTQKLMNDMFKTMHGKQLEKQVISLRMICAEPITSRYQTMTYMCCKGRTMFLPISNQGVHARPSNSIKIRNSLCKKLIVVFYCSINNYFNVFCRILCTIGSYHASRLHICCTSFMPVKLKPYMFICH